MNIYSKVEAVELYHKGLFGNHLRLWDNYTDLMASSYNGTVSIRCREASSLQYQYSIPVGRVHEVCSIAILQNPKIQMWHFYFNESAPDERLIIQGELMRNEKGLYFFASTAKDKMRNALKKAKEYFGLQVLIMLKSLMTPSSYSDLEVLMEIYPNSIIELSIYDHNLGNIPGRNTLIWEVRNY